MRAFLHLGGSVCKIHFLWSPLFLVGSDTDADSAPNSKAETERTPASPRSDETVVGGVAADNSDTKGGDNAATMDDDAVPKRTKKVKKVVKKKVRKKNEKQHETGMGFNSYIFLHLT